MINIWIPKEVVFKRMALHGWGHFILKQSKWDSIIVADFDKFRLWHFLSWYLELRNTENDPTWRWEQCQNIQHCLYLLIGKTFDQLMSLTFSCDASVYFWQSDAIVL